LELKNNRGEQNSVLITNNNIELKIGATPRLLINPSGNVGIGLTSPQQKLGISGGIGIASSSKIGAGNNYSGNSSGGFAGFGELELYSGSTGNTTLHNFAHNLDLQTASVSRLFITQGGNVGIGTTSPAQKLEVNGNTGQPATSGTTQNGLLRLRPGTGSNDYGESLDLGFHVGVSGPASYGWIQSTNRDGLNTNYSLALNPNGGNVGIGTTSPAYTLDVNGSVAGNSAYVNKSDERLKQNIETIANGLDMVMKLRPVQYKWKKHPTLNFDLETTELGFTAQEVQQALAGTDYVNSVVQSTDVVVKHAEYEEVVKEDGTKERKLISEEVKQKYFNLAESKLVAILTKAIQELKEEVELLKAKVG
jgi:hypothetical protein